MHAWMPKTPPWDLSPLQFLVHRRMSASSELWWHPLLVLLASWLVCWSRDQGGGTHTPRSVCGRAGSIQLFPCAQEPTYARPTQRTRERLVAHLPCPSCALRVYASIESPHQVPVCIPPPCVSHKVAHAYRHTVHQAASMTYLTDKYPYPYTHTAQILLLFYKHATP